METVMPEKKIDVTEEAHAALKEFCKPRNLRVKKWASKVLLDAIRVEVERVTIDMNVYSNTPDRAPFWSDEKASTDSVAQPPMPLSGLCPKCEHAWPGCVCGYNPNAKPYKGKGRK